jgi:FlaA1/EpsC-like NDP-sugar epimerase
MRVLVTGSSGFLGVRVVKLLLDRGRQVVGFDHPQDVLDRGQLERLPWCDAAVHLAAHKHAPYGEDHPAEVADLNVRGTDNVCKAAPRVVLASTCKAAAPVTCYGASKLIAERIVLNAGGTVVRLVNVLGSTGSVTDVWAQVPAEDPLPVTDCERMFIDPDRAATLLVDALDFPPGRYAPRVDGTCTVSDLAGELYPGRATVPVPLRNGDRPVERLTNDFERTTVLDDRVVQIADCWERVTHPVAA